MKYEKEDMTMVMKLILVNYQGADVLEITEARKYLEGKYGFSPEAIEKDLADEEYSDAFIKDFHRHNYLRAKSTKFRLALRKNIGIINLVLYVGIVPGIVVLMAVSQLGSIAAYYFLGFSGYLLLLISAILMFDKVSKATTYKYEDINLVLDDKPLLILKEKSYQISLGKRGTVSKLELIDGKMEICDSIYTLSNSSSLYHVASKFFAIDYKVARTKDSEEISKLANEAKYLLYNIYAFRSDSIYVSSRLLDYLLFLEEYKDVIMLLDRLGDNYKLRFKVALYSAYAQYALRNLDSA